MASGTNSRAKKWWLLAIPVGTITLLLYRSRGALHLSQFSGQKLWEAIRGANYLYLFLAIVVIYLCYAVRALRWQKFQAHVGKASFWHIYGMNLAGFSALFLLGRVAEPVRPLLIARKDGVPKSSAFGIYALERILDASCTAVIAAIGLLVFESSGHLADSSEAALFEKAMRTAGSAFSIGAACAIGFLIYLRFHGSGVLERRMESWHLAPGWRHAVSGIVLGFVRGVQTIKNWGDLVAAIFYSAVHWLLVVCVYWLVAHSFVGRLATLTFADSMLVLVFTMVGSAVQLPGVGGGAQALSIVAFTRLYGVGQEAAVAAAMILWLVTFAGCTLVGVPLLFQEGWSLRDLRKIGQAESESDPLDTPAPTPHP